MYRTKHVLGFMPSTSGSVPTEQPVARREKALHVSSRLATSADVVRLVAEEISVIRPRTRVTITCNDGALWITEDRNPADVELRPGETFESTDSGRIIVQAFAPSSYRMTVARAWAWGFAARQMAAAFRVLRAGMHALQSDRQARSRRAPLPYC